jgi:hypothetical protein
MADMNSGIILAGQPVNILGAITGGNAAAAQTNALQDQNALRSLYQTQGAGIANGDPNALNALAGIDPMAAMGVQQNRLGMDAQKQSMAFDAEKMQMLRSEAAQKAQQYAASMTAAERAMEADKIAKGIAGAGYYFNKGDRAGYDAFLGQQGIDPATHPFDQFPALAAQYSGALDALKGYQDASGSNAKPLSAVAKLTADFKAGLIDQATYQAAIQKATAQEGLSVESDGQGGFKISQGPGVTQRDAPPKLTVDAAKNAGFYGRLLEANKVLNDLEAQGTDFVQKNLDAVPLGAGNYLRSPEYQKYDQSKRDIVNAILRRESGAVISDQEFANAEQQYFPVPGDSPEVIAQKRRNRETAIEGVRVGSGEGAAYVDQQNAAQQKPNAPVVIDGYTVEEIK